MDISKDIFSVLQETGVMLPPAGLSGVSSVVNKFASKVREVGSAVLCAAIRNYAAVICDERCFYRTKHTLYSFLKGDALERFAPPAFKIDDYFMYEVSDELAHRHRADVRNKMENEASQRKMAISRRLDAEYDRLLSSPPSVCKVCGAPMVQNKGGFFSCSNCDECCELTKDSVAESVQWDWFKYDGLSFVEGFYERIKNIKH